MRIWMLCAAAAAGGCAAAPPPEPPVPGRVVFFRGAGELFSNGLDRLAAGLQQRGINASVHLSLGDVTLDARQRPIVLGGHSIGADAAVREAGELYEKGVRVELLVLIDPFNPGTIQSNVRRVLLISGRPFALQAHRSVRCTHYHIHEEVPLIGQLKHLAITDDGGVQDEALRAVLTVFGKAGTGAKRGGG